MRGGLLFSCLSLHESWLTGGTFVAENMNEGKTYHFLRAIAALPEESAPRFVMKADDDTLLVLRNWVDLLLEHERHRGGRPLYAGACPEGR